MIAWTELRGTLARLYPSEADARRVAHDAGVPPEHVDWSGSSLNRWQAVLDEASKHDLVDAVIAVAAREYPNDDMLHKSNALATPPTGCKWGYSVHTHRSATIENDRGVTPDLFGAIQKQQVITPDERSASDVSRSGYEPVSTALWRRTNHSDPNIRLRAANPQELEKVREVIKDCYYCYVGDVQAVQAIDRQTGTQGFHVHGSEGRTYFLRWEKRLNRAGQVRILQQVQELVVRSGAFRDSDFESCLVPYRELTENRTFAINGGIFSLYPCALGVTHFPGTNREQIASFARRAGRLQQALSNVASLQSESLATMRKRRPWSSFNADHFEEIHKLSDERWEDGGKRDPFTILYNSHRKLIADSARLVTSRTSRSSSPHPLLHDLHPHNTFFRGNDCVLIYDYETVSFDASETAVLAFATHRFVREFIRTEIEKHRPPSATDCAALVEMFIKEYQAAGGFVPDDWRERFMGDLLDVNLAKLISVMRYAYGEARDPAERNDDTYYGELAKFVTYLKEAMYLGDALSKCIS